MRQRCCYAPMKPHMISRDPVGQTRLTVPLSRGSMHGRLSAHRPLIMELMLWLMMRSALLHCPSGGALSGAEGCCAVVAAAALFGLRSAHFGGSQG